ncbi:MAG: MATE family efflux transporter [Aquihabitans sp.]
MPRPFDREIARLALPALVMLLAEPTYLLVDTAVVGHLGTDQLGALAVASTILLTVSSLCIFLAYGTTASVARLLGAGDRRGAADDAVQGLWLALVVGVVLAISMVAATEPLVQLIGADGPSLPYAATYLRISAIGLPALLVMFAGTGYLRGLQHTRAPMVIAVTTALLNVALDLLLIPGLGFGIGASALATVIAQVLGAVAYVTLVLRGARSQGARFRPQWMEQRRLVKVGADLALRTSALRLSLVLITVVASRIGPIELAAHQVAFEIWAFLAMGHDALAIAAQSMIGLRLGAGDRAGARTVGVRLLQLGLLASVATAVLVVVLIPVLPRLFTSDPDVIALIGFLLIWVAVLQPLGALAFALDGILIGAGDQRFLAWAMLGAAVVFAVAVAPVLPLGLGIGWLWAAFGVLMATRVLVLAARFRGDRWLVTGARTRAM